MTNVDYRKEEQRIHNARASAIADLDKHLNACGLSVDQRNKAMDLLVPILAHVNALADFNQRMNLEAMRNELRPLATLLKERLQIVAEREDRPKQIDVAFDKGHRVPVFEET